MCNEKKKPCQRNNINDAFIVLVLFILLAIILGAILV